jgi:transposase
MDQLTTVGIDLAKDVFAVCVLDVTGSVVERRVLRREAFIRWAERLSPCRVAMEACGSSHHWGRWFAARGHTTRLIAAEFVKPFRLSGKNDAADAEAIAIAARQPTMRFVAIKSIEQQAILAWHSVRAGWQEERTALLNRTRGLLAEFGVVVARSADRLLGALPTLIEDIRLPDPVRAMLLEVREQLVFRSADSRTKSL